MVAQVPGDGFAKDSPKVRGQRQVSAFVKLRLVQSRPGSVNTATAYRAAEDEHDVGVAVIGSAVAVLAGRTPELGGCDQYRILGQRTQVNPEGGNCLREVAEHVAQLSFHCALVDVMVPTSDVGEGDLDAKIRLDQLC